MNLAKRIFGLLALISAVFCWSALSITCQNLQANHEFLGYFLMVCNSISAGVACDYGMMALINGTGQ